MALAVGVPGVAVAAIVGVPGMLVGGGDVAVGVPVGVVVAVAVDDAGAVAVDDADDGSVNRKACSCRLIVPVPAICPASLMPRASVNVQAEPVGSTLLRSLMAPSR